MDAFVRKDFDDSAEQRIGVLALQREKQFRKAPIRLEGAEDADMLHLAAEENFGDAFGFQDRDELAQGGYRNPVAF